MTKLQFRIWFVFLLTYVCTFWGCSVNDRCLNIPIEIMQKSNQKELFRKNNDRLCLVCYFDGDCSICYADILSIEESCKNIIRLYISYGKDTLMTNNNIGQLGLKNINLLYDTNKIFHSKNIALLPNHIFLIDSTFTILESSSKFDDRLKNKIRVQNK